MNGGPPNRIHAWLQLLRVPNLLTVPGDPLAGYLLATGATIPCTSAWLPVVLAGLCFYAAGLILNDLCDLEEDRRARPQRPLPSGAITTHRARRLFFLIMILALVLSFVGRPQAGVVGLFLAVSIMLYNLVGKRIPVFGPLNMGVCRGLNLLLGAAAADVPLFSLKPWIAAGVLTAYVSAVSQYARHETEDPARPARVGALLRVLLILQAVFAAVSGADGAAWTAAIVLTALWPVAGLLSRRFYMS